MNISNEQILIKFILIFLTFAVTGYFIGINHYILQSLAMSAVIGIVDIISCIIKQKTQKK